MNMSRALLVVENCIVTISRLEAVSVKKFYPVQHPSTVGFRVAVQVVEELQVQAFVVLIRKPGKRAEPNRLTILKLNLSKCSLNVHLDKLVAVCHS
jgi:hypothetical protein